MEIPTPRPRPPLPPLQGYFRFRHRLLAALPPALRQTHPTRQLWNALPLHERQLNYAPSPEEVQQYLAAMEEWENETGGSLPLQTACPNLLPPVSVSPPKSALKSPQNPGSCPAECEEGKRKLIRKGWRNGSKKGGAN